MSRSLRELAARKQILLAQSQLQRMQFALHAGNARDALRPAGLMGGAIARPAAVIALVSTVSRLFGWPRVARIVRLGAVVLVIFRFVRGWRTRAPQSKLQPELFP